MRVGECMSLERVQLVDVLAEDGASLKVATCETVAIDDMVHGKADAYVVYEVLCNEKGATSGHKNILRFYTREDFENDIKQGTIKISHT